MKTIYLFIAMLVAANVTAQQIAKCDIPEKLPQSLELDDEIQHFRVTTTHYNGDIFGNFYNKQQVCGDYTRGLEGGKVRWNNVSFAQSNLPDREAEFPEPTPVNYMENFTYLPNEDMLKAEKFETFTDYRDFTKNLVWDMLGIEAFAWTYFDKLQLNVPYAVEEMNGKQDLAGQGFFENKDIQLIWTGVSKRNDESCALIEYRSMNNPLALKPEAMEMKGRSHYWGTIWVSLEDKQIEHAVLFEDVVMELLFPGTTKKQLMDATREITFQRIL